MRRRAFTLIEVVVSAVLVAVGISALVSSLGSFSQAQRRMIDRERIERLADAKLKELAATRSYQSETEGDFEQEGQPGFTWEAETEISGIENLVELRVTVSKEGTDQSVIARTLLFDPPPPAEGDAAGAGGGP